MTERLAELAVLSERVAGLRETVAEVRPSVDRLTREHNELQVKVVRLEGKVDALHQSLEQAQKDRTTYENKVEAALKKTDVLEDRDTEIEKKIEIDRWKLIALLGVSSASGGSIVGAILKLIGG
jgi:predicted nuclease with TOPRIM domain